MKLNKPNFFIIGAPKCGTTSLSKWLSNHSEIFITEPKEPHYFSPDIGRDEKIKTINDYENLFSCVEKGHKAVGEASVFYLYSKVAIPHILEYQPKAKFIVVLRNPVEMALSLHTQEIWSRNESIKNFETAWAIQWKRIRLNKFPAGCQRPKVLQYYNICKLGSQLERLYDRVKRDQVKVVFFDDIVSCPEKVYDEILKFLCVNQSTIVDFKPFKTRKRQRSLSLAKFIDILVTGKKAIGITTKFKIADRIKNLNTKTKFEPPEPWVKDMLLDVFEHEIEKIEILENRNLAHWKI
jgi:hypothetical protein